ncbi:hypothetical protein CVS30_04470 [Arthrobacter psychrolactophilus]|uniref:Uncharacterized protein n=1 Tax=Arthrobacter psychrolactophilus TaxID=92442 RepID=A0A2V5IV34_9MICC|nr:hypothetical protein [Arthrobacter psychrolactophilus]PYI39232.1 hypothetical protein CVS30_04470 [Arthrobacter psychrolactophilus]
MTLKISIALLWEEARELRFPVGSRPASFLLTDAQADALRDFAYHYRRLLQQPWRAGDYVPRSDGKIRLSVYDLLEGEYRKQLLDKGYIPKRADIAEYPDRNWSQVQRHVQHRISQKKRVAETKSSVGPEIGASTKGVRLEKSPSMPLNLRGEMSGRAMAGRRQNELVTQKSPLFNVALVPPKDPSVAAMRSKMAQRYSSRETNPEDPNIDAMFQNFASSPTVQTTIGNDSHAISLLTQTLTNFSPKDHAVLFDQFKRVVSLDRKIAASVAKEQPQFSGTNEALRHVMRLFRIESVVSV